MLRVIREGLGYNKVSDGFQLPTPVNREYCYLAADGKVYFSDVNIAQTEPQNVFVIYKKLGYEKIDFNFIIAQSAVVNGQTPAGYIKANMRFKRTAGILTRPYTFRSITAHLRYPQRGLGWRWCYWMDTTNHRMYIYNGGAWLRLAKYSEVTTSTWSLTGNP